MTIDLDGLRNLLDAATPGTWRDYPRDGPGVRDEATDQIVWLGDAMRQRDSVLMCAMKNALPDLLDAARERDTLREQNARLVEALEWATGAGDDPGAWPEGVPFPEWIDPVHDACLIVAPTFEAALAYLTEHYPSPRPSRWEMARMRRACAARRVLADLRPKEPNV